MEVVAPGAITCFAHPTTTRADLLLLVLVALLLTTCAVVCLKILQNVKQLPRPHPRQVRCIEILQPSGALISVPAQ